MRLTVVIPTFNEGQIIEQSLKAIATQLGPDLRAQTEVIIADDGTDRLPEIVASSLSFFRTLRVIRNKKPLGKCGSLALAFAQAQGAVVGFLDADLSTPPSLITEALQTLEANQTDIFMGARWVQGSKVTRRQSKAKDVLGWLLGLITQSLIFNGQRNYKDTQCGFKFFKNEVARNLYKNLVAPGGLGDLEMLLRANTLHLRVHESPVQWTDLRPSTRKLRRILIADFFSLVRIISHYKLRGPKRPPFD